MIGVRARPSPPRACAGKRRRRNRLDILDRDLIPAHMAQEPGGPNVEQVVAALDRIFATGKVEAFALVSLYAFLPEGDKSVEAAKAILKPAVERWASTPVAA
jgi:arginase